MSVTGLNLSDKVSKSLKIKKRRTVEIKDLIGIVDGKQDADYKWQTIQQYCAKNANDIAKANPLVQDLINSK